MKNIFSFFFIALPVYSLLFSTPLKSMNNNNNSHHCTNTDRCFFCHLEKNSQSDNSSNHTNSNMSTIEIPFNNLPSHLQQQFKILQNKNNPLNPNSITEFKLFANSTHGENLDEDKIIENFSLIKLERDVIAESTGNLLNTAKTHKQNNEKIMHQYSKEINYLMDIFNKNQKLFIFSPLASIISLTVTLTNPGFKNLNVNELEQKWKDGAMPSNKNDKQRFIAAYNTLYTAALDLVKKILQSSFTSKAKIDHSAYLEKGAISLKGIITYKVLYQNFIKNCVNN